MKPYFYLLITILIYLTPCNGQNNSQVKIKNEGIIDLSKVETVNEIGDNIMIVFHDNKNNYWFGSWKDGLYKYDGKIILHFSTKNGLPSNRIEEIKEDNFGNIYFNTSNGVIKFDGIKFRLLKAVDVEGDWKLEPNDLWFKAGWNSGYVYRYDGKFLHKLQIPETQIGEEYVSRNPTHPNPYTVYSIYKDSKENIWFGTGGLGAVRYNGKSFDWILEKDVVEIYNAPTEGSNGVRSIMEDQNGDFWFNTEYRYGIYDSKTLKSHSFYTRHQSIGSLDGKKNSNLDEYLSTVKDNENSLWFVTYLDGVWKYDGTKITHFAVKHKSKDITLFSIYKDNNGDLWLGTHENGAYKFNGQTFERFEPL